MTKAEGIKAELEIIRRANGGKLRPRDVWQYARKHRKSVLHGEFEWNLTKAAESHWDDRSREIIVRYVTVTVVHRSHKIKSVLYVKDPDAPANEPGYIKLTDERERESAHRIILAEIERCQYSIERARSVAAVLDQAHPGLADQLEEMLRRLVDLRDGLREAA